MKRFLLADASQMDVSGVGVCIFELVFLIAILTFECHRAHS